MARIQRNKPEPTPWDALDEKGSGLKVSDFLTTLVVNTGNALRKAVTLQYTEQFGLTMPDWRVLSVLAEARELPFGELVRRSATDKGQLSRIIRGLQERGLLDVRNATARKITCLVTGEGLALYRQVMPVARRRQAAFIRELDPETRSAVYRAMHQLQLLCGESWEGDVE